MHSTTVSLVSASTLISTRASPTDAALFLIKHLLLLKQQIVAFDIEFVTPETDISFDLSAVTNTFWELRARGGLFNPRNLVRLVGGGLVPRVVENMLDAKAELDARLRAAITDYTHSAAARMTAPLAASAGKSAKDADAAAAAAAEVRANVERDVPFVRQKLEGYLDDVRTRETLVAAVMEQVSTVYEEWWEARDAGAGANGARSGKGKGREDAAWDPEAFAEWCTVVFKVGRMGLGIMTSESDEMGEEGEEESGSGSGSGSVEGTRYGRSRST